MSDWMQAGIRSIIAYLFLLLLTRLLGKKQVSQLTLFDYIVGITIGSTASTMSVELDNQTLTAAVGLAVWCSAHLFFCLLRMRSRKWSEFLDGVPAVVVRNGQIVTQSLTKERYTLDDLRMQLRLQKAFNLSEVEFAVIENNGQLSVIKRSQREPATPADLNIPTKYKGLPTELIFTGQILDSHLSQLHLTREWLADKLRGMGIADPAMVHYAELDSEGELYVSLQEQG